MGHAFINQNGSQHAVLSKQKRCKTRACQLQMSLSSLMEHDFVLQCQNNQAERRCNSGCTKQHDLLDLAIAFPDGTFTVGSASIQGSYHDAKALQLCGFDEEGLTRLFTRDNFFGGGGIFSSRTNGSIITPQNNVCSVDRENISLCLVSVEWLFGMLKHMFPCVCCCW